MNNEDANLQSGTSPTTSPWLTAKQAAEYLQIQTRTLLMHVRQGRIKGYTLSGTHRITWRFRREDLDLALKPCKIVSPFDARARRHIG